MRWEEKLGKWGFRELGRKSILKREVAVILDFVKRRILVRMRLCDED